MDMNYAKTSSSILEKTDKHKAPLTGWTNAADYTLHRFVEVVEGLKYAHIRITRAEVALGDDLMWYAVEADHCTVTEAIEPTYGEGDAHGKDD